MMDVTNNLKDQPPDSRRTAAVGVLFIGFIAAGLWYGLPGLWSKLTGSIGPITIGSNDPKNPHAIIPPWGVITLLIGLTILSGWLYFRSAIADDQAARRAKAAKDAEAAKRLADAEAVVTGKSALEADLEARRAAFEEEMRAERERIREIVEVEWQRDKQSEIEREHSRYLGYLERDRVTKARFEAAKLQRANHLAQLEEYVLNTYPAFKMKNDPAGLKAPDVVASAFRKDLVRRWKNDAGLLRNSTDQNVLIKLGSLEDLPPSPPPISEPVLIPIPENLRRRFEGQQIHKSQDYIEH
ncbi:hypothetical protein PUR23_29755 [Methylorubrum populi]|uniref:hypothetical protein n=1 Tax=Methylorubrum populi TaxID=223967 RepID=UPI0031F8E155